MNIKTACRTYEVPIRIYWKIVAGPTDLHKINLSDAIFDDSDFRIRKMDPKTRKFIKFV